MRVRMSAAGPWVTMLKSDFNSSLERVQRHQKEIMVCTDPERREELKTRLFHAESKLRAV